MYKKVNFIFRTTPTEPVKFVFEETLVEDSAGKLLPNQLTVDNLTVEWLKTKLGELEASIKENQEKRALLSPNSENVPNGKVTPNNDINNRLSISSEPNKKEVNELKCMERKMVKQTELIKSALNELGCEEAPPGLEDITDSPSYINNPCEQVKIWLFLYLANDS